MDREVIEGLKFVLMIIVMCMLLAALFAGCYRFLELDESKENENKSCPIINVNSSYYYSDISSRNHDSNSTPPVRAIRTN